MTVFVCLLQQLLLGRVRKEFAKFLNAKGKDIFGDRMNFLWVTDFPLFEKADKEKCGFTSTHHPFTAPHPDDIHLLESSPLQVLFYFVSLYLYYCIYFIRLEVWRTILY